jgi:hypothetical protein
MLDRERTEMLAEWIQGGANDALKEKLAAQEFSPETV